MSEAVPVLDIALLERSLGGGKETFLLRVPALRLDVGERVAVVGLSGSGKSTLLAMLALSLRPDRADRFMMYPGDGTDMRDIAALWAHDDQAMLSRMRAMALGFVPQTAGLLPFLSLRANIALSQEIAGRRDPGHVKQLAARLDIASLLDRKPNEVSVGQRLRAAIARALAHRPVLVLADEPTAAVHPDQADEILELLADTAADGVAVLVSTHDVARARAAGYRLLACEPDPGILNASRLTAAS